MYIRIQTINQAARIQAKKKQFEPKKQNISNQMSEKRVGGCVRDDNGSEVDRI